MNYSSSNKKVQELLKEYKDVFSDVLEPDRHMKGEVKIHIKENSSVKPYHAVTARRPPKAREAACKNLIEELTKSGVIVPATGPTPWCSPSHFVDKPGGQGKVRLVTNFTMLNREVKRPVHGFSTAQEIRQGIASESRYFCCLDLVHGYFQQKLEKQSAKLTTFVVSYGEGSRRYNYARSPMGLSSSGDEFCKRTDLAIEEM